MRELQSMQERGIGIELTIALQLHARRGWVRHGRDLSGCAVRPERWPGRRLGLESDPPCDRSLAVTCLRLRW